MTIKDVIFVAGLAAIATGFYLMWAPLAFVFGGGATAVLVVLVNRKQGEFDATQQE